MQILLEGPRWAMESIQAEIQREWEDITVSELFAPDTPLSELGQVRRLVGAPRAFTPCRNALSASLKSRRWVRRAETERMWPELDGRQGQTAKTSQRITEAKE